MSDWPPVPPEHSSNPVAAAQPSTSEKMLESILKAHIEESRRARRWNLATRIVQLLVVLFVMAAISRSCNHESAIALDRSQPHLAIVDIMGEISSESLQANSQSVDEALERAFSAASSKAIVLRINSPGGSPVESDNIWRTVRQLKGKYNKKVYAVVGDMATSGAYYVATAADEIIVNPSSVVGSIGVILPNYGVGALASRWGVEDRTMTSGAHKNILSMTRPVDAFEKQHVQAVLDNVHQHFIDAVKQGRGKRLINDEQTFSGLFWSGEQAIGKGLADREGNLNTLIDELSLKHQVNYSLPLDPLQKLAQNIGVHAKVQLQEMLSSMARDQQRAQLQ